MPTLLGMGYACVGFSPPEFKRARICFYLAAMILGSVEVVWYMQSGWSFWWRVAVATAICLIVGIGLPETLRWVGRREQLSTQPPASTTVATSDKVIEIQEPVVTAQLFIDSTENRKLELHAELKNERHALTDMRYGFKTPDSTLLAVTQVQSPLFPEHGSLTIEAPPIWGRLKEHNTATLSLGYSSSGKDYISTFVFSFSRKMAKAGRSINPTSVNQRLEKLDAQRVVSQEFYERLRATCWNDYYDCTGKSRWETERGLIWRREPPVFV